VFTILLNEKSIKKTFLNRDFRLFVLQLLWFKPYPHAKWRKTKKWPKLCGTKKKMKIQILERGGHVNKNQNK
jgi:hypothetical protein